MNVSHTIIQCTVILGLSPKDTRPHPNTLPIRSLPEVNFWVFHHRDLSPFLICLTQAFTFHHYFIFFLSFFHFIHFSQFLSFLHITIMQMNVMKLITLIHMYHQYHQNYSNATIPKFPNNSNNSNNSNNPIQLFSHNKITKNFITISQKFTYQ